MILIYLGILKLTYGDIIENRVILEVSISRLAAAA